MHFNLGEFGSRTSRIRTFDFRIWQQCSATVNPGDHRQNNHRDIRTIPSRCLYVPDLRISSMP
jgi:hypothetical protein